MTINPPRSVRLAIYVLTILGTPLVAYLNAKGIIGALEVTLWSAEVSAAGILAAVNTTSRTEATVRVDAPNDVNITLDSEVSPAEVGRRIAGQLDAYDRRHGL